MNIVEEVRGLNLPLGRYMISGSGILGALGIRECGDIDLLVTEDLFDELVGQGWQYAEVEIEGRMRKVATSGIFEAYKDLWYSGFTRDVPQMIGEAVYLHGLPFLSLEELKFIKGILGREKDKKDIELIESYQRDGKTVI